MNTQELVDELVQRFNGWNRDGEHGVLRYLNTAQNILLMNESDQNLIIDEDTGTLPVIATTATERTYNMPTTVWRVSKVLIAIDEGDTPQWDYGFRSQYKSSFKNSFSIGGRIFAKVPYIRQWDYVNSDTPAKVTFTRDPGTTTSYYFRESYGMPTQITAETIQPSIGMPFDSEILLPATAKLIEGVQSGNYIEAYQMVSGPFKKAALTRMNGGDQGCYDGEAVDRGF